MMLMVSIAGLLGSDNRALVMGFLLCGLSIMGLTFGPMGALLPELFPTEVRYTRASFSYYAASILGASVALYTATWLATRRVFLRRHASSSDGQPDADRPAAERNPPPVAVIPACGPCNRAARRVGFLL